jgi:hypothetical protein
MKTRRLVETGVACLILVATLAYGLVRPVSVQAEESAWVGEYYNNRWLNGTPTAVRADDAIAFDWGDGSPDNLISSDDFSVRWTRSVDFEDRTYRFTTLSDDGVRLYVDGDLLIDEWYDMTAADNSAEIDLSAGTHVLRLEYYENEGDAVAELSWEQVDDNDTTVGNIITCVRPQNSWIKVYRWDGSSWVDVNSNGYGPLNASGYLKLDGMYVDTDLYGDAGNPYRVELWADGSLITAVGNTAAGQSEFRVHAETDNATPWACPAP